MHPAPPELQERWRATGAWTDETLLGRFAAADPQHVALVDGDTRLTIGALHDAAARYASVLWARGVRPGGSVAWPPPNWWEAVAFCWSVWRCGAVASPITPTLRA